VAWKRVSQDPATCQLLVDAVAVVAKVVGNLLQEYYTIQSIFVTFPVTKSWRICHKIGLEITLGKQQVFSWLTTVYKM
jgi:hypothetical protein